MRYSARLFLMLVLSVTCSVAFAQIDKVDSRLRQKLENSDATSLHRVFLKFKSKKIFSDIEKFTMNSMTKSERDSYYLEKLHSFATSDHENVVNVLKQFAINGQAKILYDLWTINCMSLLATKETIDSLIQMPEVENLSLLSMTQISELQDNGLNNNTTYMATLTTDTSWGLTKMDVPDVWDLGVTGDGVTVAVIDGGFDYNHPDFFSHRWNEGNPNNLYYDKDRDSIQDSDEPTISYYGYDVFSDDNNPIYEGSEQHGTECAGIVAGDGTLGYKSGVAPDAKLMFIRCLSSDGQGSQDQMMAAISWIHSMYHRWGVLFDMPKIISMSASCKFSVDQGQPDDPLRYADWRDLMYVNYNLGITHCNSI
jgi:hypothetical protein